MTTILVGVPPNRRWMIACIIILGNFGCSTISFSEKNIIQKYRNLVLLEDVFSDKTFKIICSYMFLVQKKMPAIPRVYIYGIFTYIYHRNQLTVGKYTIHGSYGIHFWQHYHYQSTSFNTPSPNLPPLSSSQTKRINPQHITPNITSLFCPCTGGS